MVQKGDFFPPTYKNSMSIEHEHLYLVDERKPEGNDSFSQRLFFNTPHIVSAKGLKLIPDYFFYLFSAAAEQ